MDNIDVRARKYATHNTTPWTPPIIDHEAQEHYGVGATKQREIDINKACEWMENHLPYYCDEFDETYAAEAIRDFREAMAKEN